MAKYVKLGSKANMFSDPTLNMKVLPRKVVKLPKNYRISTRITKAIQNGHLIITDKNDTIHDDDDDDDDIVNATEAAIKLMSENDINYEDVIGSGADDKITKGDVEDYIKEENEK